MISLRVMEFTSLIERVGWRWGERKCVLITTADGVKARRESLTMSERSSMAPNPPDCAESM